jgi:fatty acid desaturase
VLAFWLCAVAGLMVMGRLDLLLWYWLVPRFTVFPILFFWDDMLGHYSSPRTGTREMRGLWFRIFCAHGTNFHNVHHLFPAVPWFNMEEATRIAVDESAVDVARGFVDGMRQLAVAQE